MKKIFPFLFLFLFVLGYLGQTQSITFIVTHWGHLKIDLEIGKGGVTAEDRCFQVNRTTRVFSSIDEAVYVVARITIPSYVSRRIYRAVFEWYAPPNGRVLYHTQTFNGLKRGYIWCIWSKLPIKGTEVADKVGLWNIRINVPGLISKRLSFNIKGSTSSPPTGRLGPSTRACPDVPQGASWQEVISWARRAVVFIACPTEKYDAKGNRLYDVGSGVIISPDGYVLTAAHVVEEATGPIKVLVEEKKWYEANLIRKHPKWDPNSKGFTADIALLKIEGATELFCLPLGDSDRIAPEQEIRILGFPRSGELGLGIIVAGGKVLGIRRQEGYSFIQFDAHPVDKGHSGGPIINSLGEVVGLVIGSYTTEVGEKHQIGIAINSAKDMLVDIISKLGSPPEIAMLARC